MSPYSSVLSPGGVKLVPCLFWLFPVVGLLMLDGRELLWLIPGEFAPFSVTLPSGATVLPYRSLLSPGGVKLVPCVFCVVVAPCELESLDWAVTMLHDSNAIDARAMKFFILILPRFATVVG